MLENHNEVASDNVIGRLYNLIYALKQTKGSNAEDTFGKVFSLEENDRVSILTNYAELFKMCNVGINKLEQLKPKRLEKYKDTLSQVSEGLSKIYFSASRNVINNGMDKFNDHFSSNLMISLESCADYLSEHSTEEVVEDERILELLKEVYELEEFIVNSKLQSELEKILIYQLNNVRESLLKYKFYGSQGIIDSVATTLGTLILHREKIEDNKDKGTVEHIFKLVAKINSIFSLKDNSIKLVGEIFKKLTGGE
jgi:gluconate kinase